MSIIQLVKFPTVETGHPDSNPQLDKCAHIFLDLFYDLIKIVLSVAGDVPVDI